MSALERRFGWLCGNDPAPPRGNRPEQLLAASFALAAWRILPWTAPRLLAWAGPDAPLAEELRDAALAVSIHALVQIQLTTRVARALDGSPYALMKGAAARAWAWDPPELRGGWDIDVGVPEGHLAEAERAVRALGYTPAVRDRRTGALVPVSRLQRAVQEVGHYELCTMVREQRIADLTEDEEAAIRRAAPRLGGLPWWVDADGALLCRTAVDLHHGLVPGVAVDELVEGARSVTVAGAPWRVASPEWALAHLALKRDHEGTAGPEDAHLRADHARLIARVRAEGRVDAAVRLLQRWPAHPECAATARELRGG